MINIYARIVDKQQQIRKAKNYRTKYHADETVRRRKVSQIRSSPSAELQNRRASISPLSHERKKKN
jgi:hypothetical protein